MLRKPRIRLRREAPVEELLAAARFVAGRQQYRLPPRIECERGAPFAVRRGEALVDANVMAPARGIVVVGADLSAVGSAGGVVHVRPPYATAC
jgi:hypothetical protein